MMTKNVKTHTQDNRFMSVRLSACLYVSQAETYRHALRNTSSASYTIGEIFHDSRSLGQLPQTDKHHFGNYTYILRMNI